MLAPAPAPAPTHHTTMKPTHVLAAAFVLAAAPVHAQPISCYSTLFGQSCVGNSSYLQVQPTVVPGQYAISGQDSNGRLYGCQANETVTGDVVSNCR